MAVAAAQKNREMFAIKKSYSIEVSKRTYRILIFRLNKFKWVFTTTTTNNQAPKIESLIFILTGPCMSKTSPAWLDYLLKTITFRIIQITSNFDAWNARIAWNKKHSNVLIKWLHNFVKWNVAFPISVCLAQITGTLFNTDVYAIENSRFPKAKKMEITKAWSLSLKHCRLCTINQAVIRMLVPRLNRILHRVFCV